MPVIQWVEHLAKNIEELIITGFTRDLRSVDVVLLSPVDLSQIEEGIPVVKGLPQLLKILFRIANDHGGADLGASDAPL
jgi:hypothetical protein